MLKIYTDKTYLTEKYRKIIFPLLFDIWYLKNKQIDGFYALVDLIVDADIVIVPIDVSWFYKNNKTHWLFTFIEAAHKLQKNVWVYSSGDFGISLNRDVFTFRLGGFHSKLNEKTFILPGYTPDPYKFLNEEYQPLPKTEKPQVGFVGNASGGFDKYLKELFFYLKLNFERIIRKKYCDYQSFYPSSLKRYKYLKKLENSNKIDTNFIFRKKYRAGARTKAEIERTTLEFYKNIQSNAYTFCLRGSGNFSIRFYETLAMGRIPIVIDTDFRLPLHPFINWNNHCILVKDKDLEKRLIDFHRNIDAVEFEKIQRSNRNLWKKKLTRDNYFIQIYAIFKNEI